MKSDIECQSIVGSKTLGTPERYPSNRRAWYGVILLMIAYSLSLVDRTILSLLVEPIERDLKISDTQFSLLAGIAFAAIYSIAAIPIGALVDRSSRRRIIGVGISVWTMMTMFCGFATNYALLFIARVGVGLGEATLNPSAYSLIADLFPKNTLAKAVAVYTLGASIGMGSAFLLGGPLVGFLSAQPELQVSILGSVKAWHLAFLAAGAPGLVLAPMVLLSMPEPRRISHSMAGDPTALVSFLRHRKVLLILHICAFSSSTLVSSAFTTWVPALLVLRNHGRSVGLAGMILGVAVGGFGMLGYLFGGSLADRWLKQGKYDAHMRVGYFATIVAVPFALGSTLSSNLLVMSCCLCGLFFAISAPLPAAMAGLQLVTPSTLRGKVTAIYMMIVSFIALGFGPLITAIFTDHVFHDRSALPQSLTAVSLVFLPSCAAAFGFNRKQFSKAMLADKLY